MIDLDGSRQNRDWVPRNSRRSLAPLVRQLTHSGYRSIVTLSLCNREPRLPLPWTNMISGGNTRRQSRIQDVLTFERRSDYPAQLEWIVRIIGGSASFLNDADTMAISSAMKVVWTGLSQMAKPLNLSCEPSRSKLRPDAMYRLPRRYCGYAFLSRRWLLFTAEGGRSLQQPNDRSLESWVREFPLTVSKMAWRR